MQHEQTLVTYEYRLYEKTVYVFSFLMRFPIRRYLSLSCSKLFSVRNGPKYVHMKTKEIYIKYPFFKGLIL